MYGRRKTSKTGRAGSRETSRRSQNSRARDRSIRWSVRALASIDNEIEGDYQ